MKISVLSITLLSALPLETFAHPGHGSGSAHDAVHYLTEPTHVLAGVLGAALVLLTTVALSRRWRAR